ncbi:MAG: desulfoferrodoxin family protein, partial [Cellulosilyticaceae bacterium]
RVNLNAGDKPEAFFNVDVTKVVAVREYCNLHGLWKIDL